MQSKLILTKTEWSILANKGAQKSPFKQMIAQTKQIRMMRTNLTVQIAKKKQKQSTQSVSISKKSNASQQCLREHEKNQYIQFKKQAKGIQNQNCKKVPKKNQTHTSSTINKIFNFIFNTMSKI